MTFAHQILQGVTWHARQIPTSHEFHYPYRFWAVNLTQLADNPLPNVNMGASDVPTWLPKWLKKSLQQSLTIPLLSQHHWALYQFHQADYFAINRLDAITMVFYLQVKRPCTNMTKVFMYRLLIPSISNIIGVLRFTLNAMHRQMKTPRKMALML